MNDKIRLIRIAVAIVLFVCSARIFGWNSAYLTFTLSGNDEWKITQDAYVVSEVLFLDYDLYYPEDLFIKDGKMYIADSGNARVVVFDLETEEISTVGDFSLWRPTGVFVGDEYIYVADPGTSEVVLFDKTGKEVGRIGRPKSFLFGEFANYNPSKVVVDKRGNLYIVSEGTFEGVIQLDRNGEFLGYFGANRVGLGFLDRFIDLFYTSEQKSKLLSRIPKPYENIAIDDKGLIFTLTQNEWGNAIKKHNTIGNNILSSSREGRMTDEPNFTDIAITGDGRILALTETGLIYEYDPEGNLVFSFGGRAISSERYGLFSIASGIACDEEDRIYVLDGESGLVHVFNPTEYAQILHEALNLYVQGKYLESKETWRKVMTYDGYLQIAHYGLGKAYFQSGEFEKAAIHFKEAYAKREYSDTYWELRNAFVQSNMHIILPILLLLIVVSALIGQLRRRGKRFHLHIGSRFLNDLLYIKNMLRHPLDSFYYLQSGNHGSVLSAAIIYVAFFTVIAFDYFGRSFIFNLNVTDRSVGFVLLTSSSFTGLWIVSNYLVSSINDGRGTFKDVVIFTAYSFAPYILFQPLVILMTYVLTYNEKFLIDFLTYINIGWSSILLFTGVKEIHDYDIKNTIKSLMLTLGWIFVMVLVYSIVYMLWDQLIDTAYSIAQEAFYRAR
ncbi:YIP1 family protein [Mesotoga sp.]|uniref:YIP1 family protein n=1 Tax=Mesotoga sp. TaxID=2053577 RepID=UPI00345E8FC5